MRNETEPNNPAADCATEPEGEPKTGLQTLLATVDALVAELRKDVDRLASGFVPDVPAVIERLRSASDVVRRLGDALRTAATELGVSDADWADRDALVALVERVEAEVVERRVAKQRRQLAGIAELLAGGRVVHRLAARQNSGEQLRRQAVEALRGLARCDGSPPVLPGPDEPAAWLGWWWERQAPEASQVLDEIANAVPALAAFLEAVERHDWFGHDGAPSHAPATGSAAAHTDGSSGGSDRSMPGTDRPRLTVNGRAGEPARGDRANRDSVEPSVPAIRFDEGRVDTAPLRPPVVRVDLPAIRVPVGLSPKVTDYDRFARMHWITPDDRYEEAPWEADLSGFAAALHAGLAYHIGLARFPHAYVLAVALDDLGETPPIDHRDVAAAAAIWAAPGSAAAGIEQSRVERLRSVTAPPPAWARTATLLEALRPSGEARLFAPEIEALTDERAFRSGALRTFVRGLLTLAAQGVSDPMRLVRTIASTEAGASVDQLRQRLERARRALHETMKDRWKAAGGVVQRTHCRHAWDEFIADINPVLRDLYPVDSGGKSRWDEVAMEHYILAIPARHGAIADAHGARMKDRHRMDNAARLIADCAKEVNDAVRDLLAAEQRTPPRTLPQPVLGAFEQLHQVAIEGAPDEEFCRRLLLRDAMAAGSESASEERPLAFTVRDVADRPALLAAFDAIEPLADDATGEAIVGDVSDIHDYRRAAAILQESHSGEFVASRPTLRALRDALVARGRDDLLVPLTTALPASEQARIRQHVDDYVGHIHEQIGALRAVYGMLSEIAAVAAPSVYVCCERASQLADNSTLTASAARVVFEWTKRVRAEAERILAQNVTAFRAQPAVAEAAGEAITRAIEEHRFADALTLLRGEPVRGDDIPVRASIWRPEAVARFESPRRVIAAESVPADERWLEGIPQKHQEQRGFRSAVAQALLEEELLEHSKSEQTLFRIPCDALQRWLVDERLNPTFVPQLRQFQTILLLTPLTRTDDRAFVESTARLVSKHQSNLPVVLAPNLSASVRDAALAEFRKRSVAAALIDDLDFCRLFNPRGPRPNGVLALLEVAFEQQRWDNLSPFAAPEGQLVPEMYVGRTREARELATTRKYSRLFSGRKLGKSALLRYVEHTYDGTELPSQRTLRVLYVPVVGAEHENDIAERILRELRRVMADVLTQPERAVDRLIETLSRFINDSQDSLLIVLDEADVFVEAQLREYERHNERCLTFRLRTDIEGAHLDEQGLPRVRFVFSGYRATHTRAGAWANWGDVLTLDPLDVSEASKLIAGPLARLGIDAAAQSGSIAHRCGYQPAVILKFGERLLRHLDQHHPPTIRGHVAVTYDDVAATFAEAAVQDEIHTIVMNNFAGNRLGEVIFTALLLDFRDLPPGYGLAAAAERVVTRLQSLDGGSLAMGGEAAVDLGVVEKYLRDFVERKLLVSSGQEYFLKFPHHLPVLCRPDLESAMRQSMRSLREQTGAAQAVRALLPANVLEDLREARTLNGTRAAIVASHWPEAMTRDGGGVADRLGLEPSAVVSAAHRDRRLGSDTVVLCDVNGSTLDAFCSSRPGTLPAPIAVGGADLLRWSVERAHTHKDETYELAALGRLGTGALEWWFRIVRGIEFHRPQAIALILEKTTGIPILVRAMDRAIAGPGGHREAQTLGAGQLDALLAQYDASLAEVVAEISPGGTPALSLEPREMEILQMVCVASVGNRPGADLFEDLTVGWKDLHGAQLPAFEPLDERDWTSLAVVQRLGLLPVAPQVPDTLPFDRLVALNRGDALYRLAGPIPQRR